MRSFVAKLRIEIEKLEEELAKDTRPDRLESLKVTLAHYEGRRHVTRRRGEATKGSIIHTKVVNLLKQGPRHRADILKELAKDKIVEGGERDMDYLASRLSMWSDVATDGKGNWQLAG